MGIPLFQIDAFAGAPFRGNPAAVCLMDAPGPDGWLQAVAGEMNLSETAFVWKERRGFRLRWFTPTVEVDLCGHATLAAAQAIWQAQWAPVDKPILFHSRGGPLQATREGGQTFLDFPALPAVERPVNRAIVAALGVEPVWFGRNEFDYLVEVEDAADVYDCQPDFLILGELTGRGTIVTARSDRDDCDFVSRFFAPACGIDEDPVTGSAHVCLGPYWAAQLKRSDLIGYQASRRGGLVATRMEKERVRLGGEAVTVFRGELLAQPPKE